jgi:excisionase family DNA binding protein
LTIGELCQLEHISRRTLESLWARGEGPAFYRAGKQIRIRRQAREEWRIKRELAEAEGKP